MKLNEVCLLNDSFPPFIDGVANTVINYARVLKNEGCGVSVVTPECPEADDSAFDYPVIRYPSVDLRKTIGYTAGNPFDVPTIMNLSRRNISILHSHCPIMSNTLARSLRETMNVPFIMTYHTKFDVDIANAIKLKLVQAGAIKALVDSVSACDELWVVSEGAGRNIRDLGYQGEYIVMRNGVDMPRHRASEEEIANAVVGYDLPQEVPVFLFVGRLMWYKGLKIILDALAALKYQQSDFRMVFIGGGGDEAEVRAYTEKLKLGDKVIFTGAIRNRDVLSAWYSRADLFLFPSTFDTNGLVVREAAACSLGSVLVDNSCAAEGVKRGEDSLLIEENAASLAVCLSKIMDKPEAMRRIGEKASENLYMSWDESVKNALERYEVVIDNHKSGLYRRGKSKKLTDEFFVIAGDMVELFEKAEERRRSLGEKFERYL